MELDLIQNIAQIAPGFIGVAVNKLMTGDPRVENFNDNIFKFFLYAGASWLLATISAFALGQIQYRVSQTGFITISMMSATLLGVLWPTIIRSKALSLANCINLALGQNEVFLDEKIMEHVSHDNKPHYYEVYRNSQMIASGWAEHISNTERAMSLIKVDGFNVDEMKEIRNIVWQESDMVIKEYTMPEKIS